MSTSKTVVSTDTNGTEYTVDAKDLIWRPSAYAIVVDDDKLLLTKRSVFSFLPGGGLNLGEHPEEAVIRETKEETGMDVANPRLVTTESGFYTWQEAGGTYVHIHMLRFYYICDLVGGELSLDGAEAYEIEFGEMPAWVPLTELDNVKNGGTGDWRDTVKLALNLK